MQACSRTVGERVVEVGVGSYEAIHVATKRPLIMRSRGLGFGGIQPCLVVIGRA